MSGWWVVVSFAMAQENVFCVGEGQFPRLHYENKVCTHTLVTSQHMLLSVLKEQNNTKQEWKFIEKGLILQFRSQKWCNIQNIVQESQVNVLKTNNNNNKNTNKTKTKQIPASFTSSRFSRWTMSVNTCITRQSNACIMQLLSYVLIRQ